MTTLDVKKEWLNPIRAAQAACHGNEGYAVVTLTVLVRGNEPVIWLQPQSEKLEPKRLASHGMSVELLGAIADMIEKRARVDETNS